MEEKEIKEVVTPEVEETKKDDSLAEVIKKQKEIIDNSVSKEEYDKVLKDRDTLKDVVLNGGAYGEDEEEETINLEELGKHIFDPENQDNNLEYIENVLKYRKTVKEKHGYDIFAPRVGAMNAQEITDNDFAAAEKVADVLQQCVDESDGDSSIFTAKLQSRIMDDGPIRRTIKRR